MKFRREIQGEKKGAVRLTHSVHKTSSSNRYKHPKLCPSECDAFPGVIPCLSAPTAFPNRIVACSTKSVINDADDSRYTNMIPPPPVKKIYHPYQEPERYLPIPDNDPILASQLEFMIRLERKFREIIMHHQFIWVIYRNVHFRSDNFTINK